jgi:peptide deformylase
MLELLKEDDKNLLKKSKRVDKIDDKIRNIAANMVNVMLANNGVGLAAPQVGILKRMIVVLVNEEPKVLVNPEIVFASDNTCKMEEGCLSFPGQYYEIERPEKVTVKYRSLSGHPILETHEGLVARCLLHEIDHLDGIVFLERLK